MNGNDRRSVPFPPACVGGRLDATTSLLAVVWPGGAEKKGEKKRKRRGKEEKEEREGALPLLVQERRANSSGVECTGQKCENRLIGPTAVHNAGAVVHKRPFF